ncbi:MAG: ABC transporter ATP-binding protein, partial [Clostridiales bacterium]|nr:ABC transporter ATP-binding protein [Clostridiales bacterium]
MMELVSVRNVDKRYHSINGEIDVVRDLSFSIRPGEFVSIVGPSGCGKTTILSMIAGLVDPSGGDIQIHGKPVNGISESAAYMLQRDHLFEWRTIEENILLGLEIRGKCSKETRGKALALLNKYGLRDFSRYHPQQLSGGMRQRVALIRTLAVDPELLLLDEPFSSLDYQTRLALSDEIAQIIRQEGKTAILVTHDIAEAISMSDRVLVLTERPASIKMSVDIKLQNE